MDDVPLLCWWRAKHEGDMLKKWNQCICQNPTLFRVETVMLQVFGYFKLQTIYRKWCKHRPKVIIKYHKVLCCICCICCICLDDSTEPLRWAKVASPEALVSRACQACPWQALHQASLASQVEPLEASARARFGGSPMVTMCVTEKTHRNP